MSESIYLVTPVGRMLQGDPFLIREKKFKGIVALNRQTGVPKMECYIGVAVRKGAEFNAFWLQVQQKAQLDFPGGEWNTPGFAWKIEDGDAPQHAAKEGFAGHYLLKMSSMYAPKVWDPQFTPLTDVSQCGRGDFVQVQVAVQGNGMQMGGNPGMYMNPQTVMRVAYGTRISTAPDPRTVFVPLAALPAGASLTPVAVAMPAPAVPVGAVAAPLAAPVAPVAPAMPVAAPVTPVAPLAAPVAAPAIPGAAVAPLAPAIPGAAVAPLAPAPVVPVAVAPLMPGAVAAPAAIAPAPTFLQPAPAVPL